MHRGVQSFSVGQPRLNNRGNNGGNSSSGSNDRSNGSTAFPFEEGKSNGGTGNQTPNGGNNGYRSMNMNQNGTRSNPVSVSNNQVGGQGGPGGMTMSENNLSIVSPDGDGVKSRFPKYQSPTKRTSLLDGGAIATANGNASIDRKGGSNESTGTGELVNKNWEKRLSGNYMLFVVVQVIQLQQK